MFRCPISLDLFEDPVTLCTGQTYDRSSIEKWLALGNLTCPVTMQKLHDLSIVPNLTLRHLIHQWLQYGNPDSDSSMKSLASLKLTLQSHESTLQNKVQALEKITVLSDESIFFQKSCFLQLGFLSLLLQLVFEKVDAQNNIDQIHMGFIELSLSCVQKLLPLGYLEPLKMLKDDSILEKILFLFENGTITVKTNLCHLIDSAASSSEEVRHILGSSKKLIHEILLLLNPQNCKASESNSMAAIKAISALCNSSESRMQNLVEAGAIYDIITCISGSERKEKNMAPLGMSIIEKLLMLQSGKEALVRNPESIKALVKMVFSFRVCDEECSESAIGLLLIICCEDEGGREEAINGGLVTKLLLILQSQCSNRIKTKARRLLKMVTSKSK